MIEIRETTDLKEAEKLWRSLSPHKTIFDEWDWRYCFYKYNPHPLRFMAAYETGGGKGAGGDKAELVGLLPLARHPKYGLEFLAEDPCEENRLFIKPGREDVIPILYEAVDEPAKCYDITGDDEFTRNLPLEDYKYILPLQGINSFSDFLNSRLSSKRRRSLAKELEELEKISPESLLVDKGQWPEYLELLFRFNTDNFAGESYLIENEQAAWRDLLKLSFNWRFIAVKIKSEVQAVSLSVFYKGEWHYLITGVNFKDWPGLGKYLVKVNIEAAILAQAEIFDAGLGDCGWKHLWHFDRIPQHEFRKLVD